jgi:anti-sigma B factor antagonist
MTGLADDPRTFNRDVWNQYGSAPFIGAHYDTDHVALTISGDLDLATAPELRRRVLQVLSLPIRRITLDLHRVGFLDSSGVSNLVALTREAADRHIELSIARVPAQALRVLEMTHALHHLRLLED